MGKNIFENLDKLLESENNSLGVEKVLEIYTNTLLDELGNYKGIKREIFFELKKIIENNEIAINKIKEYIIKYFAAKNICKQLEEKVTVETNILYPVLKGLKKGKLLIIRENNKEYNVMEINTNNIDKEDLLKLFYNLLEEIKEAEIILKKSMKNNITIEFIN